MKLSNTVNPFKLTALAALLAMSLSACQKSADPATTQPTDTTATTPAAATETPAPAQTAASVVAFSGSLPAEFKNTQCALDMVNGQPPVNGSSFGADSSAALGGWVGNGAGEAANGFNLVLKGASQSFSTPITADIARQDVATSLNAPALASAGFTLNLSFAGLPAGDYSAYLLDPASIDATACDLKYSINIK